MAESQVSELMDELKRATSRLHNDNDTLDKLAEENKIKSQAIDKA